MIIDGDVNADDKADITISGGGTSRIFSMGGGSTDVALNSLTLTNGTALPGSGGAIYASYISSLTIEDSSFTNNTAQDAGALWLYGIGDSQIRNTLFTGNSSTYNGGAVYVKTGITVSASVENATFYDNSAGYRGGGIYFSTSGASTTTLSIYNSTVSGNAANTSYASTANGGGIAVRGAGANLQLYNTVVADNVSGTTPAANDLYGTIDHATNSFFQTSVTITNDHGGNQNNAGSAGLGTLADNGGTTQTLNALAGSALIDAGSNAAVPSGLNYDANGGARIQGSSVDIGATETEGPPPPPVTFTVTTLDDETAAGPPDAGAEASDGAGLSLREAIHVASDGDTIVFDDGLAGGTLTLTQGYLLVSGDITINGDTDADGKADITISGDADSSGTANAGDSRIFLFAGSDATLESLTLTKGYASSAGSGGAILVQSNASLAIRDTTISDSVSTNRGGGIYSQGDLEIENSLIEGNFTTGAGGGINTGSSALLTVVNSTIHGNSSYGGGGGIVANNDLTLINSTITGNHADADGTATTLGGGISVVAGDEYIQNSVIAENTSGSGAYETANESQTVIAYSANSFFGASVSITNDLGGNIDGGGDPLLGDLADNGGTVQSRKVHFESALRDAGNNDLVPSGVTQDADGNPRVADGIVDIGATELTPLVVTTLDDEEAGSADLATDLADGNGLSLREAIALAQHGDAIVFDESLTGGTLVLTQGEIDIGTDILVDGDTTGDRRADITISGDADQSGGASSGDSRIFEILSSADATLQSLTLTRGYADGATGGAIRVNGSGGALTLVDSTISDSVSTAQGGAILNHGTLEIESSLFTGNHGDNHGGAIYASPTGSTNIVNSTFYANTSNATGGAITVQSALTVTNSTIVGNQADADGSATSFHGGIRVLDLGEGRLYNTVVAGNTSGSGAYETASDTGNIYLATNSFFGVAISPTNDGGGNINGGGDPLLGTLQDNGGTTQTLDPLSASPLIDAGDDGSVPSGVTLDANGNARIAGSAVDIGATESAMIVTTTDDETAATTDLATEAADGNGLSLREAIAIANNSSSADAIRFDSSLNGQTITLTNGEMSLLESMTIDGDTDGDGAADVTISGGGASRIFHFTGTSADVDLVSLNLTDGYSAVRGGAIYMALGTGSSTLDIVNTTLAGNEAAGRGGAIAVRNGNVNLINSLVTGNTASTGGGGLYAGNTATLNLINTTVHANASDAEGGGLFIGGSDVTFLNSTITGNHADADGASTDDGGGIFHLGASALFYTYNSVIAGNTSGTGYTANDVDGTVDEGNGNFFGTAVSVTAGTGNQNNAGDPGLGELLDNGGATLTRSPLDGSALIGAGLFSGLPADQGDVDNDANTAEALPRDGRDGDRVVDTTVDIGAVEQIVDETIIGTAQANTILGGQGTDVLFGLAGNDILDGGSGADAMSGGEDDDTYTVDDAGDTVTELAGQGTDQVNSGVGFVLGANLENLSLLGGDDINGVGNELGNILIGNSGNNILDGLGGIDTMVGNDGDDTYVVDSSSDIVSEAPGQGTDQVNSSVGFTLFANLENLSLLGSADVDAIGNDLDNNIFGNAGNNTLDGLTGADNMIGGLGDDIYVVDNVGDSVSDSPDGGTDQVNSYVSFTLFAHLENLSLLGSADINAIGNDLDNTLIGNSGNNTLDGLTGADNMIGNLGNDIFVVDNVGDTVSDVSGGGTDQVNSWVGFALVANIENLSLLGSADIDAIGNELDNNLFGNSGNNTLDGLTGADLMVGGDGDDIYVVDNVGDSVSDNAGPSGGIDQVNASVSFTLFANLEHLSLLGSGNIDATGNELDNNLFGNSGNNVIIGNAGNDLLIGNGGNDTYVFGDGCDDDIITDFSAGSGAGDVLNVAAFGFADFAAVLAATDDSGGSGPAVIQLDGDDSVTLQGVLKADLAADDFVLA